MSKVRKVTAKFKGTSGIFKAGEGYHLNTQSDKKGKVLTEVILDNSVHPIKTEYADLANFFDNWTNIRTAE